MGVAHQRLRVVEPVQRVVVADVGHHQLVADVAGAVVEQQALFDLVNPGIEVPICRELRGGGAKCGDASERSDMQRVAKVTGWSTG